VARRARETASAVGSPSAGRRREAAATRQDDLNRVPLAPPAGMVDLLLPESAARRALAATLLRTFGSWGYDLVTTPPFEHAEVIERGLPGAVRRDVLRFVEPTTGEVALLRPDITVQIARVIATRLRERPPPWRLCYEGTVVRQPRGRSGRRRQIAQAGVELVGAEGVPADAEVVQLAAKACAAVGLDGVTIELRQVRIGRAKLDALPAELRGLAEEALAAKDRARLETVLVRAGLRAGERRRVLALTELYGGLDVIGRARRVLSAPGARRALAPLEALVERLVAAEPALERRLAVDLGEVRGQAYYTGVSFALLASGPGEPVGTGGRYDEVLGRFGFPQPATGFALDLPNLEWALARQGRPFAAEPRLRVLLVAADGRRGRGRGPGSGRAAELADALRAAGVVVAPFDGAAGAAGGFAAAWGYDAVLVVEARGVRGVRVSDGATRAFAARDALAGDALAGFVRG
jgi:ATP phosphoribosyltransferase regulatory subunit